MNGRNNHQTQNKHTVERIKNGEDIERIRSILNERPRDLLLFTLAVQTGIRMKELLTLKVKHLLGLKVGDRIPISNGMLDDSTIIMSKMIYETFLKYLKQFRLEPDDYLFKSRRGRSPLNLSSVSNMIKGWFEAANIERPFGEQSLRKMWEYSRINKSHSELNFAAKIDSMKFLEPIEMLSAQEMIYKRLFEAIISGKIPPGARLTTAELCQRFKVSPTPVRVALNWLEARGFVISQKKRAYFIKELSLTNWKEIIAIRLALETFGVELSCKACTEETLIQLELLLHVYERTTDLDEFQQTNNQFHQTLCRDAKMPLLQQLIGDLCCRVSPYFVLYIFNLDSVNAYRKKNFDCHRRIYEGMRRRDPEEVCKWLKVDLIEGMDRLEEAWKRTEMIRSEGESYYPQ